MVLGLFSLFISPFGISVMMGNISVDIPWSQLFPILISLALGWRYGLLSGLSGGAFFPFLLWPVDGWANVTTSLTFLLLFILLGIANEKKYLKAIPYTPLKLIVAVCAYIVVVACYDSLLFNTMLSFNPTFWESETLSYINPDILYGFIFKDGVNAFVLMVAADTLLRIPVIRRFFGKTKYEAMQHNTYIFITTLFIPVFVWLTYIGLDYMLLRENNMMRQEHKSFALFVILGNGFLVSRLLFYYSEKQYYIREHLYEKEKKYKTIFENVQDVFYQTDLQGKIIEVSPSILSLTGYSRLEFIGDNFDRLYESQEDKKAKVKKLLENGELINYEANLKTKNGTLKYVSINTRFILDELGKPSHIDGVIRDVTERKKNELKIELQNQKLQNQNKELEQFAYIASHDLQEPLQTLMSISKMFKEEYSSKLDKQGDTYIEFIHRSSSRMQELVRGLLDYARIGNSGTIADVDCNLLVKEVALDLDRIVQDKKASIEFHDLPVLRGYSLELKQLFQNLISNALKFTNTDVVPKISITAKKQNKEWLFAIADNGIGIDPKNYERIFIIFKRLHNRNEYEGTGIGLSHCKKIVALHGGNIWVAPTPGGGSTFYFTLNEIETE